jgi:hypothetical protein
MVDGTARAPLRRRRKGGGYVVTAFHLLLRLEVTMTDPKAVVDLMLEGPP